MKCKAAGNKSSYNNTTNSSSNSTNRSSNSSANAAQGSAGLMSGTGRRSLVAAVSVTTTLTFEHSVSDRRTADRLVGSLTALQLSRAAVQAAFDAQGLSLRVLSEPSFFTVTTYEYVVPVPPVTIVRDEAATVVGVIIGLLIGVVGTYMLCRWRRKKNMAMKYIVPA